MKYSNFFFLFRFYISHLKLFVISRDMTLMRKGVNENLNFRLCCYLSISSWWVTRKIEIPFWFILIHSSDESLFCTRIIIRQQISCVVSFICLHVICIEIWIFTNNFDDLKLYLFLSLFHISTNTNLNENIKIVVIHSSLWF